MPILTFTSDFGSSDHLVGGVKGEILKLNEGFQIIDITHDIIPYNFMQAAYVCRNIFSAFPPESFHLVLVNAFDSNVNHLLLIRHKGQILGIPDNGLITMVLNGMPDEVVAIPFPPGFKKTSGILLRCWWKPFRDCSVASGLKNWVILRSRFRKSTS